MSSDYSLLCNRVSNSSVYDNILKEYKADIAALMVVLVCDLFKYRNLILDVSSQYSA